MGPMLAPSQESKGVVLNADFIFYIIVLKLCCDVCKFNYHIIVSRFRWRRNFRWFFNADIELNCEMCPAVYFYHIMKQLIVFYSIKKHTDFTISINTLRPRQNGRHIAEDIFKCIFVNKNVRSPIKFSLKSVPKAQLTIFQHWIT